MAMQTVFCVQPYLRIRGRLAKGELAQFSNATQAGARVEHLEPVVAGVVLYAVKGYPEFDCWGDPDIIDKLGDVPEPAF